VDPVAGRFPDYILPAFTLTNGEKNKSADLQKTLDASRAKAGRPVTQDISVLQDTWIRNSKLLENARAQFAGRDSSVRMIDDFVAGQVLRAGYNGVRIYSRGYRQTHHRGKTVFL